MLGCFFRCKTGYNKADKELSSTYLKTNCLKLILPKYGVIK